MLKSLMLAAVVAVGLMFGAAGTAEAGGPHYRGGHGHHHHHHHRHHGYYQHRGYHNHYYRSPYSYRSYRYAPRPAYYRGNGIYYGSPGFSFGIRF